MRHYPHLEGGGRHRHAFFTDVHFDGDHLSFWFENVRRFGLVHAGVLRLNGVTRIAGKDSRSDTPPEFVRGSTNVWKATWSDTSVEMETSRRTGQDEAVDAIYRFDFAGISNTIGPCLIRTARALVDFYPMNRDFGLHFDAGFPIPVEKLD